MVVVYCSCALCAVTGAKVQDLGETVLLLSVLRSCARDQGLIAWSDIQNLCLMMFSESFWVVVLSETPSVS